MTGLEKRVVDLLTTAMNMKIENERLKAENKALRELVEILKNQKL